MNFKNDYLLSVMTLFYLAGMLGSRPLIPLLASQLGAGTFEIGVIVSLFAFLPFFFAIYVGQWIDRIGLMIPLVMSIILGSLSLALLFWFPTLNGIYVSQIIGGITQTIFVVAAQSMAGSKQQGNLSRDRSIMRFSMGAALGSFVGPLIGGRIADVIDYSAAFGSLALLSLLAIIFTFVINKEDVQQTKEVKQRTNPLHSFDILKKVNIRRAFLITILVLLAKDLFIAYFPLLGKEYGLSDTSIGMMISLNALAAIFVRWAMPYLIERLGRNNVIVGSIVFSGFILLLLPIFKTGILLGLLSFALGLGVGIGQPLSISSTIAALPKERVGEGLGLRLTSNRLTQLTTPLLFGLFAEFIGLAGIFWLAGSLILMGTKNTRIIEE